ncbi:MAG: hypothetical protein KIT84_06600 [Labilithrix sp.]|nr:hypothetical protein [Labilithrix sp.]MCW5810662.1 hypothetical protein [Labilithrix sp.]
MSLLRRSVFVIAAALTVAEAVVACSSDDPAASSADAGPVTPDTGVVSPPGPVKTPTEGAASVGPAGGDVMTGKGTGVEIPSGALSNNVQITVKESPGAPPPAQATPVGTPHVFGPSGLEFNKAVTVVLELDPAKLPAGKTAADVVVLTAPDGTTSYERLPTTVRDATHVAAETTHFSVFVPAVPTDDAADDGGPGPDPQDGGGLDGGTTQDGGSCQPLTCASYAASGDACGVRPDGCGDMITCTETCGDDGGTASDAASHGDDGGHDGGHDAGDPFAHCPEGAVHETEPNDESPNEAPGTGFDFCGTLGVGDVDIVQFVLDPDATMMVITWSSTPPSGFGVMGTADGEPFTFAGGSIPFHAGKTYTLRPTAPGAASYNIKVRITVP